MHPNCGCSQPLDCNCTPANPCADPCSTATLCRFKLDANCVLYNYANSNAPNYLPILGLPNGTTLYTFMNSVDAYLGGLRTNVISNGCLTFTKTVVSGINTFIPTIDYTCLASNLPASTGGWAILGNAGTNPSTNFLGTTDDQDIVFKRHNIISGILNSSRTCTSFGVGALPNFYSYTTFNTNNTALGYTALGSNTTGATNTAVGLALVNNTIGNNNVAVGGSNCLGTNISGNDNIAIGVGALFAANSSNNIAIGSQALNQLTSGSNNVVIGYQAATTQNTSNAVSLGTNAVAVNNQLSISPQVTKFYMPGMPTAAGSILTDLAGNGILSLQPQVQGGHDRVVESGPTTYTLSHTPKGFVSMFNTGLLVDPTLYSVSGVTVTYTGSAFTGSSITVFTYIY